MTTSSPTCAHCGYANNKSEFRFCRGCGAPLDHAAHNGSGATSPKQKMSPHVISQQPSEAPKTPPANGARHKLLAYVAVVGIALVLPTSIVLLFLQSRNLPSKVRPDEQVPPPTALAEASAKPTAMTVSSSTPLPTNSPLPSPTEPTRSPEPTSTPAPTPTPTPVPITALGTVLENGEIWYGNGVALSLKVTRMDTDKVWVDVYVENVTSGQIFGEINPSMFRLRGPLGTAEIIPSRTSWVPRTGSDFTGEKTFTLKRQGERFVIAQHAYFAYDLVDTSVKELYIDVVGLPGIDSATWKIIVRQ